MLPKFKNSTTYTADQIMMTLSAIAYANPGDIPAYLANPKYATMGEWNLVWGPGVTTGNLMYVVKYKYDNIYAVVIRGTVVSFSFATLVDLYEDLDVGTQMPWRYPQVPGAFVAGGTLYGLSELASMLSNGMTLFEFLASLPDRAFVFATGHSLGGCLTTVLAPWLQFRLSAINPSLIMLPITFAAPTAGNDVFANWYTTKAFEGRSSRLYNQIDIIPMLWANLPNMQNLFPPPGPSCPSYMKDIISVVNDWLVDVDKVSYSQPNGNGNPLPGSATKVTDWFLEASMQHDHNYYLKLLNAPPVSISGMAPARYIKRRRLMSGLAVS